MDGQQSPQAMILVGHVKHTPIKSLVQLIEVIIRDSIKELDLNQPSTRLIQ